MVKRDRRQTIHGALNPGNTRLFVKRTVCSGLPRQRSSSYLIARIPPWPPNHRLS